VRTGLLWYDDSDTDLAAKVLDAAERYEEKFGDRPNRCYVHADCLEKDKLHVNGIVVLPSQSVLPNHFWVGKGTGNGSSPEVQTGP
jgi:hypothetical protein